LQPPRLPFVTNVTGTWITDEQATDPAHWGRHVRLPVRFGDCVGTLWTVPDVVMVEIGPTPTLITGALQHPAAARIADRTVVASLHGPYGPRTDQADMLRAAGRLWLAGCEVAPTPDASARRVPLPTYCFDRRTYRLDPTAAPAAAHPARRRDGGQSGWYNVPSWRRLPAARPDPAVLAGHRWLIFADETGAGRDLATRLAGLGAAVWTVAPGPAWSVSDDGRHFVVTPGDGAHHDRLARALRAEAALPDRVVHCWTAVPATGPTGAQVLLTRGFQSLMAWAKATETELATAPQRWDVVSADTYAVTGDEPLRPAAAAVQGICRVLAQEYPSLDCVHLDLSTLDAAAPAAVGDRLIRELAAAPEQRTVALRGPYRWAPTFEPCPPVPREGTPVRRDGVYLITGGLGRIGLLVARALAEQDRVRLVLLGRTGLPPREAWDDAGLPEATRSAVAAVRGIEKLGSEVLIEAADVSDRDRMTEVKRRVLQRYGRFDGVVHCAGVTGSAAHRGLAQLSDRECDRHFAAKLHGTQNLIDMMADQHLHLAMLCSSVAALLGGLGFGAYASANATLDACAHRHHRAGQPWMSVNWEAWIFGDELRHDNGVGNAVRELAMTPAEGRQVFEALLRADAQPQVAVSTGDLTRRRELWAAPTRAAGEPLRRHERPNLRSSYVGPASATEQRVAEAWQEVLGLRTVGVHDNFFELGGSSLLGLQIVHRLRLELGLALPLTIVYEGPTVRTLGALIDDLKGPR
jgi:acyl transferase domain-containing protein